jgi:hypothetical protein
MRLVQGVGALVVSGAVFVVASGCGGAETKKGNERVSYAEWCSIVCEQMSLRTEAACGAAIMDAAVCVNSCDRGRGAALTNRTYDEANACVKLIGDLSCEGLGVATGSAMMGQGEYADRCVAR